MANDKWSRPRSFEPRNSMYLQNNVPPGEEAKMHISVPIHDFKFMMDINKFREMDRGGNNLTAMLDRLNSVRCVAWPMNRLNSTVSALLNLRHVE